MVRVRLPRFIAPARFLLAAMEPDHRKLSRLWITVHAKNGLQGGDRIVIRASNEPENHDETPTPTIAESVF